MMDYVPHVVLSIGDLISEKISTLCLQCSQLPISKTK